MLLVTTTIRPNSRFYGNIGFLYRDISNSVDRCWYTQSTIIVLIKTGKWLGLVEVAQLLVLV